MDLLASQRIALGISSPYFFANPNAKSRQFFRGSDCLRKFSNECGANFPVSLRSTLLRKHLATTCQVLNLKSSELEGLANFMGHNIRVHEDFYRLPEGTLQAAKISKILLAMENGKMSDFKGKSLEEIDINPDGKLGFYVSVLLSLLSFLLLLENV